MFFELVRLCLIAACGLAWVHGAVILGVVGLWSKHGAFQDIVCFPCPSLVLGMRVLPLPALVCLDVIGVHSTGNVGHVLYGLWGSCFVCRCVNAIFFVSSRPLPRSRGGQWLVVCVCYMGMSSPYSRSLCSHARQMDGMRILGCVCAFVRDVCCPL